MTRPNSGEDFELQLRILVVDDEPGIATFLQEFLTTKGFEVKAASDGAQALDLLERGGIHMALVDLTLPDMGGLDVVQKAKQIMPDLVAIVMSGTSVESREELVRYGVDEFIAKPFGFDELNYLLAKYEKLIRAVQHNKHLQERLRAEQEKSGFFSEAGHQLKTPIAVLKEFAHLFREGFGGELSAKQSQYLECIDQNIDRLLYLVDNIENLSRVESAGWTIRVKEEDPRGIVNRVASSWRPILESHDLRFIEEVQDDLPMVLTDAAAVEQVLFNLVDNASKYGPAGGIITIRSVPSGDRFVRIEVEDQGPGIPEEKRETIFQPFTRLPEHESSPGLGLGLTVARGLMKRMGGDLWLDPGGKPGNRFCLQLRVVQPPS